MHSKRLGEVVRLARRIVTKGQADEHLARGLGFLPHHSEELVTLQPERAVDQLLFRKGDAAPIVIQIPHARDEVHLEHISRYLFDSWNARALWLTMVKRKLVDSAHDLYSDFTCATVGALQADPGLLFLSLHGFMPTEKNGLFGTDIILSGGMWWPTTRAVVACRRLKSKYRKNSQVRCFPHDVTQLGGTTNIQGAVLRGYGLNEQFVHVELSTTFRALLKEDEAELKKFSDALYDALTAKPNPNELSIGDPWACSIGRLVRQQMSGKDMVIAALGVTAEEYEREYEGHPRKIANKLGVTPAEVIHYLTKV